MTEEKQTNWLEDEQKTLDEQKTYDGERLPALKLEENKISEFTIDFTKPFEVYEDIANKATKAIIPVKEKGEDKIWWLNKKNPVYHEVIHAGREGITEFKVVQTGNNKTTKYAIVKDKEEPITK